MMMRYAFILTVLIAIVGCTEKTDEAIVAAQSGGKGASSTAVGAMAGAPAETSVEICAEELVNLDREVIQWEMGVTDKCLPLADKEQDQAAAAATLKTNSEIKYIKPSLALTELEKGNFPYLVKPGSGEEERLALAGNYQAQKSFAQAQTDRLKACMWRTVIDGLKQKTQDGTDFENKRVVCKKLDSDSLYEARKQARIIIDDINSQRLD
jgi:hypothetical protein